MDVDATTNSGAKRRSRLRSVAKLVALVGLAVVLGVVVLEELSDSLGIATDEDIVVDEATMGTTTSRLRTIGRALNELPSYEGATAEPAEQSDCVTDSGDLFQPSVGRIWTITGSEGGPDAVAEAIGKDLSQVGWSVGEQDQFGDREVVLESGDGWTARGSLFVTYERDAVVVDVGIANATPCSLE
jgi:hypothetical protein